MHLHSSMLPYLAVLIAVVIFVQGGNLLISGLNGGKDKAVSRRLRGLGAPQREASEDPLRRKSLSAGKSPWLTSILESVSLRSFDRFISTSGIRMTTERVLFLMIVGSAAIFELLDIFGHYGLLICAAGGFIGAIVFPLWLIYRIRRRRLAQVTAQMPDAIDMLVRSMRAGHPVATGVGLVAQEMLPPIGIEFADAFDEMSYGSDLRQALEKMAQRLRIDEINYMVAAIRIQSSTGGNLAEVLNSLSNIMREKKKLRARVKALSAEARFSGIILSALPVFAVVVLLLGNPHYYDIAQTHGSLKIILGAAATLMVVGVLLIRKFVNIRI